MKLNPREIAKFLKHPPFLKSIVSVFPAVAAIILAFIKERIFLSTSNAERYWSEWFKNLPHHGNNGYDIIVTIYWVLLILWIYYYFTYVSNEFQITKKNNEAIRTAIFRAPNPNIYVEYKLHFEEIMEALTNLGGDFNDQNKQFQEILKKICDVTSEFVNQKQSKKIYGANIMLFLSSEDHKEKFPKLRANSNEWFHMRNTEIDNFTGVLYLVPELSYKLIDGKTHMSKPICLPVVRSGTSTEEIGKVNLPGAPFAALAGEYLFEDVRKEESYSHLGKVESDRAKKYWLEELQGVRSIYSFAIPLYGSSKSSEKIVGVLNIDSTEPDILGTSIEYNSSFIALMYPIVCQLSPSINKYHDLYMKVLESNLKGKPDV